MAGAIALLDDRKVLEVSGPDARSFLQRLITNDVETLSPGVARYAALLTPQGKIVSDFLVIAIGAGFLIDAPAATAQELARKLALYRLRAKVEVVDRSADLSVVAWASDAAPRGVEQAFADPRHPALWARAIVRTAEGEAGDTAAVTAYQQQRIAAGVPDGGVDFAFGETFPHEANLDRLHGVDFRKGCYVGQEVVSRVEHRGTARKRVVTFSFDGEPPARGSAITVNDTAIGVFGSGLAGRGLGMVRVDRVAEAMETGEALVAAGVRLRPLLPA